ncbi:hypothetical protein ACD591_14830 [Rufibacter glacialis]|uniref:Uncharacterized protein n=1 Tax=Rufibacter glacialis TaxID=1259555 RepID=A0A5M8QS13_9BACT|nr:hypothetical protein [Rufibacter glacialis]KAA6437764.1 hypothetical protein FOE74_04495 [Rufibacter glacialis]GGK56466.1 hypothetical protein GCM10011405_00760 [Rufibacter glacialis]
MTYYQYTFKGQPEEVVLPHLSLGAKALYYTLAQGNLAVENVFATWYSSILLLMVSCMCLVCFATDRIRLPQWRDQILSYGWLGLSLIFAALSFDEIGSFHETMGDFFASSGISTAAGWNLFYFLIGLVVLYMGFFGFVRFKDSKWALALAATGIFLFASIPFQEFLEINALNAVDSSGMWQRPISLLLLEEGSELFGSWCFLLSTVLYVSTSKARDSSSAMATPLNQFSLPALIRSILYYFTSIICGLGLTMAILMNSFDGLYQAEAGIPENWFPSALAFSAFIASWAYSQHASGQKYGYLSLAAICLLLSIFFACNVYGYYFFSFSGSLSGLFIKGLLIFSVLILAVFVSFRGKSRYHSLGTLAWALSLTIGLIIGGGTLVALGSFSFVLLLFSLLSAKAQPAPVFA